MVGRLHPPQVRASAESAVDPTNSAARVEWSVSSLLTNLSRLPSLTVPSSYQAGLLIILSFLERRTSDSEAGKSYVSDLVTTLQTVKTGEPGTDRRQAMTSIIRIVRSGNTNSILENFRTLLRVLLENLEDSEGSSRALVFGVLTEMLKQDSLIGGFHAFTELIILKVLQAHKDPEKDVSVITVR